MRTDRYCYLLIFSGLLGCVDEFRTTEIEQWEAQAAHVEIIRDNFGIPHIYGKTDADAVIHMKNFLAAPHSGPFLETFEIQSFKVMGNSSNELKAVSYTHLTLPTSDLV